VLTLALGIGANAAILSVVRGVLLKPLTNRDEDRLIYIRQSAPGLGTPNVAFSVPEIDDLKARVKSVAAFGDFSEIGFTMVGLGEPRVVSAGVVSGSYFDVMGLRPVLGRLINSSDDGPNAAGAVVLTHRFWTTALQSDPSVIGKTVRLDSRVGTIVGVLEPTVPYPQETEIIANVVTSVRIPATMVTGVHRMTELFGRWHPAQPLRARADADTHGAMVRSIPRTIIQSDFASTPCSCARQIISPARTILLVLLAAAALVFVIVLERLQPDPRARCGAGRSRGAPRSARTSALRHCSLRVSFCAGLAPCSSADARPMVAVLSYAARFSVRALDVTVDASML
jgi:hypothetical protein